MKNYKALVKYFIITGIVIAFSFTGFVFAKTIDGYKMLQPQSKIPVDKIISITLDGQIRESTLNTQNVYVRDTANKAIPVNVRLDSSKKTILVEPVKKYDYGKTYTVFVRKTVKFTTGKYLSSGLKMSFTTVSINDDSNWNLPVLGSADKLKQLVDEIKNKGNNFEMGIRNSGINFATDSMKKTSEGAQMINGAAVNSQYSTTNIQVQGVDEGDTVKTDGQYIYKVNSNKLSIIKVLPDNSLKLVHLEDYKGKNFSPGEIYIDNKYIIVIGSSFEELKNPEISDPSYDKNGVKPYYLYQRQTTRAIIYDISNRDDLKQLRQVDIEGNYISSRKIGSKLYIAANKYLDPYCVEKGIKEALPSFRDSAGSTEFSFIGYDKIRYFPDSVELSYLITAGINLDDPEKTASVSAYLGAGNIVFVSLENMYVSISKYIYTPVNSIKDSADSVSSGVSVKPAIIGRVPASANTIVYKFSLNNGNISYADKAEVPGTVLNQFSMDENKGYLRIATTLGQAWWGGTDKSQNNLYILDSRMNVTGKIEGLAPGEKIYSSRFIGDRGYIVTYKKVDPLFVVDLKNPEAPKVVGYLKIPGYSQYLHPYDENHIIGIGKDSIEIPDKSGKPENSRAFYLGMKAAIFDITDVEKPKEMFVAKIGDRGTNSDILYDHKALLFSRDKNLIAFPVNMYELKQGQNMIDPESGYPEYGTFTFQGALVYNIDLNSGFKLKGKITHYNNEEVSKNEFYPYDESNNINRIIYIGDTLYTISDGKIRALDINDLKVKGEIALP